MEHDEQMSHHDRIRQVEALRRKIDSIGTLPIRRAEDDDISGNDDQRFCRRETFEGRMRFKQRCSKREK